LILIKATVAGASRLAGVTTESNPTMPSEFNRSLENILHRFDGAASPPAAPVSDTVESRHRKWFAEYAPQHVMPRLAEVVEQARKRGLDARCRLRHDGELYVAELVIVPPKLPQGARPPQLAIAAAPGPRGLSLEYTGAYPGGGARGGFGGEVQYDTIYTSELEAHILEFVRLATGA
jgi:hypothetical protein